MPDTPQESDEAKLQQLEREILASAIQNPFELQNVPVTEDGKTLHTVVVNGDKNETPLLLIHGAYFASPVLCPVVDRLSKNCPLFLIDLPGCGQSLEIPKTEASADKIETFICDKIDAWRKEKGINKLTIVGCSLGGYITACYSLRYPQFIKHAILIDPWGFPERDANDYQKVVPGRPVVNWFAEWYASKYSLLGPIRLLGETQGKKAVRNMVVKSMKEIFENAGQPQIVEGLAEYAYYTIKLKKTGERTLRALSDKVLYVKDPIESKLKRMDTPLELSLVIVHPDSTKIPGLSEEKLKDIIGPKVSLQVKVIENTTHENVLFSEACLALIEGLD